MALSQKKMSINDCFLLIFMIKDVMTEFCQKLLHSQKKHSFLMIISVYCNWILALLFIVFIVYKKRWLTPIYKATFGLLNPTLIVNIFLIVGIVWGAIIKIGKIQPSDLGLKLAKLKPAFIFFGVTYLILNLILSILNPRLNPSGLNPLLNKDGWYPYWTDRGLTISLGLLFAQVGCVFFEEIFYRGYLFTQLTHKFAQKYPNRPNLILNLGALSMNLLFAVSHIPIRLFYRMSGIDLISNIFIVFGMGYLFTILYFCSGNIYISMVGHLLWNISFTLFYPIISTMTLLLVIFGIYFIVWILYQRRKVKNKNLEIL